MMVHRTTYTEPFVVQVQARGFRSIAECKVDLASLSLLLGFNASGKSNFLDILRFVSDAVENGPVQAAGRRGGLGTLLHRSAAHTMASFKIQVDLRLSLPDQDELVDAAYGFEIGPDPTDEAPLLVLRENGSIKLPSGVLNLPLNVHGRSSRLRLPASATDEDAPQAVLEAAIRAMRFYDLDTNALSELDEQPPRAPYLGSHGEHLGRVLGALAEDPIGKERFDAYLSALVPGALGMEERKEGRYSTVQAWFRAGGMQSAESFLRESLSEGTLRGAGTLAALLQPPASGGRIPLIGIEEPETALHPANVNALYEAMDDASQHTQVIVTSQSSDLLDSEYANVDHILAVANDDGVTHIGPVDAAGRAILDKGIMSLAELHRSGQMRPAIGDRSE
jgi:predicted ATPase